ncbi:MAG: class I SAM-dependent methyltransferase [Chthoniobacterales bacterium]
MDSETIHRRESDFHDEWASSTKLEEIRVRETFEAPTAMENAFILKEMGNLKGKRLLDVGTGLGESAVYFALQGAEVTALDLSEGMVETAVNLGKFHGVNIQGVVAAGENLNVPAEYFDIIYSANTIHHVTDKPEFFQQIQRALKAGGWFFTWDPLAYNPLIELYRRMATKVRTDDEAPLTFRDVELAKQYFINVQHREFWILTLLLFCKYFAIDRIHPNQKRYWKLIYEPQNLGWWKILKQCDHLLTRLPLIRRLAWNMVMFGQKAETGTSPRP